MSIAGNELAATAVRGTEQRLDGLLAGEPMVVMATEVVPGESVTVMATEVTTEPSPSRSQPPAVGRAACRYCGRMCALAGHGLLTHERFCRAAPRAAPSSGSASQDDLIGRSSRPVMVRLAVSPDGAVGAHVQTVRRMLLDHCEVQRVPYTTLAGQILAASAGSQYPLTADRLASYLHCRWDRLSRSAEEASARKPQPWRPPEPFAPAPTQVGAEGV